MQPAVDASRTRALQIQAATEAYYEAVVTQARASGDDFITVAWKLDVAHADKWLEYMKVLLAAGRPGRDSDRSEGDNQHPEEQNDQELEALYSRRIRKASAAWFAKTALFRVFISLTLGLLIGVLIGDVLSWAGFTSARALMPSVMGVVFLAMPLESYASHIASWIEQHRVEDKLTIAGSPFVCAFFLIQNGSSWGATFHAIGWLLLAIGSIGVAIEAKDLSAVGWKEWRKAAKAVPGGALLFLACVIIETVAAESGRQLLAAYPRSPAKYENAALVASIGSAILATWWLWYRWQAPTGRRGGFSLSRVIGGAADAAGRGKMLLVGVWFAAVGFFVLYISFSMSAPQLTSGAATFGDFVFLTIGLALGGYWFFARGLGPIWSALSRPRMTADTHGSARFATVNELQAGGLLPRANGIYLGQAVEARAANAEIGYRGGVHLVTIGRTGSGKGTGLIIPNLSTLRRSILIIDPKGEAAAITARKRAAFGRVVVLNPFNILAEEKPWMRSDGFNPLSTVRRDENFLDDCTIIGQSLVKQETGGSGRFFSGSAHDLVTAFVMHEILTRGADANLANVRAMLAERWGGSRETGPTGIARTLALMATSNYAPLRSKAGRFATVSDSTRDIISTAGNETAFIDSPPVAHDLASHNDFRFARMKDEIVTVYLILPATHLETHSNWLRLIIASALRELLSTPASKTMPPVLFMLDEFAQLSHLPAIANAMNIARSFGVQLWPFVQDLTQLKDIYHDNWENFLGASAALTAFAPREVFTSDYLSRLCGNKTIIVESENERTGSIGTGLGRGPQGAPLIRPEELRAMPPGQILCLVDPVKSPFMAHVPGYWATHFRDGLDDNPYHAG